jgi:hypothetical protein
MRLYSSKIPVIAREIIDQLTTDGDIEVENRAEAQLDIEAVLREYLRTERELTERAKDVLQSRGLSHDSFGKVKRAVAEEKNFGLGDEGITWMSGQILETFMQSRFVDEIYSDDADLRKKMRTIMRRHMLVDEELDAEVRTRIKNLQEGTSQWDIEYSKVIEQIKQKRGIHD